MSVRNSSRPAFACAAPWRASPVCSRMVPCTNSFASPFAVAAAVCAGVMNMPRIAPPIDWGPKLIPTSIALCKGSAARRSARVLPSFAAAASPAALGTSGTAPAISLMRSIMSPMPWGAVAWSTDLMKLPTAARPCISGSKKPGSLLMGSTGLGSGGASEVRRRLTLGSLTAAEYSWLGVNPVCAHASRTFALVCLMKSAVSGRSLSARMPIEWSVTSWWSGSWAAIPSTGGWPAP